MDKRTFLKKSSLVAVGAFIAPNIGFAAGSFSKRAEVIAAARFDLPALPYAYGALEPYIDEQTMRIHHDKHHAGYTAKLNAALEESGAFKDLPITEILASLTDAPGDIAIRNNGGGYYNHSLYWEVMGPNGGGEPSGKVGEMVASQFGSFDGFKKAFSGAASSVFGSGWAWLSLDESGKLFISSTPNQDNPLMRNLVDLPGTPVLGMDVWEHAYYLKHQNERGAYIDAFFKVIDWARVEQKIVGLE